MYMCVCVCVYIYIYLVRCSVVSNSLGPMDCSPPDSSVHGIFQAKVLECDAIAFSYHPFKGFALTPLPFCLTIAHFSTLLLQC